MDQFKILLPTNWNGCELKLMNLNTEKGNDHFRNKDIVLIAILPESNPKRYLKDGDLVCLKRENIGDFEFHIFIYNEVIKDSELYYTFTPTSNFLKQKPFEVKAIQDAKIAAKVICAIHDFSKDITFGLINLKKEVDDYVD